MCQRRHLAGTSSRRKAIEFELRPRYIGNRVEQLLRLERLNQGLREVPVVFRVRTGGRRRMLINPGGENQPHERFQREAVVGKALGKEFKKRSILGRVRDAKIVDRLDESPADEVIPNAIGLGLREERIINPVH